MLGIKAGVVDIFNNGFYDYLVNYKAIMLIRDEPSLLNFFENKKLSISDSVLIHCGLKNDKQDFDVGDHLLNCLKK